MQGMETNIASETADRGTWKLEEERTAAIEMGGWCGRGLQNDESKKVKKKNYGKKRVKISDCCCLYLYKDHGRKGGGIVY